MGEGEAGVIRLKDIIISSDIQLNTPLTAASLNASFKKVWKMGAKPTPWPEFRSYIKLIDNQEFRDLLEAL